jgi:phytanoyl-CoA hydroxylase
MLVAEQVRQYREKGFCVYPGFFSDQDVAILVQEIKDISRGATLANHDATRLEMEPDQGPDGTRVRRIYEPCHNYEAFRVLSESHKLLDSVQQLIGPNLTFHYSKINMKPSAIGSIVEWHQDLAYYPLTNQDSLAVLVYLDDADSTNGCLKIIPGVQRIYDHTRDGLFQGKITEPVDDSKAVPIEGKAGTAIFMHCMALHASSPNRSSRSRRTLILSYRAADAFPIYVPEMTVTNEKYARHVCGEQPTVARFNMTWYPIPRYPRQTKSLYELQELGRKEPEAQVSDS